MKKINIFIVIMLMLFFGALTVKAEASNGSLAKDGCHKNKETGLRHFHLPKTRTVAGICYKVDGKTFKVPQSIIDELSTVKEKIVKVDRFIDPTPELLERVETAEDERNSAVHAKINAVNQSRTDRQAALLANQDAKTSNLKMLQYEKRMQDMQSGAPPCMAERKHGRFTIWDNPWGDDGETHALKSVLDCLDIGE